MNRCPPGPTRTATPFPSTRFFRSPDWFGGDHRLGASGASLLAHDRCRPPCPAAAGAHQPGARRLDEPDCLSHDAGRFVLAAPRSEEHTSELQSLMRNSYAVFCLKKKITKFTIDQTKVKPYYT